MGYSKKKIQDIVKDDYVNASVLFYFGIAFFEYSDKTLQQVCQEKGLEVSKVIKRLESAPESAENGVAIEEYPIDLIIEYLKHAHYLFVKKRLPYLSKLIESFETDAAQYQHMAKDLKFVFPLFIEDFIHHIYQEEDTLFTYIKKLCDYKKGLGNPSTLFYAMEQNSLQKFAMEHDQHDDEMRGIRKIADNYTVNNSTPLHVKVIFCELKALEKELITHANVENNILFPKALGLEREVKEQMMKKIKLN